MGLWSNLISDEFHCLRMSKRAMDRYIRDFDEDDQEDNA